MIFLLLDRMSLQTIIGVMSGTSMDGLDVCLSTFESHEGQGYSFDIQHAHTFKYDINLLDRLSKAKKLPSEELFDLDKKLGLFFADSINQFIEKFKVDKSKVDAIASHGHTIFHQPNRGFTVQIGCGDTIASRTGIQVINDFRQKDVIAGGQGAPLVPIGDHLLFGNQADAFLNIGGFANISIPSEKTIAFDISPGNLPLNSIAQEFGRDFDEGGIVARSGKIDNTILEKLNNLSFYNRKPPKSLGTEWLEHEFIPILNEIKSPENRMRTCVSHLACQIDRVCKEFNIGKLYLTGGGVYNTFLLEEIKSFGSTELILPTVEIIEFKEALIFGFLGALYLDGKTNVLSSVTGASKDVTGGVLHLP